MISNEVDPLRWISLSRGGWPLVRGWVWFWYYMDQPSFMFCWCNFIVHHKYSAASGKPSQGAVPSGPPLFLGLHTLVQVAHTARDNQWMWTSSNPKWSPYGPTWQYLLTPDWLGLVMRPNASSTFIYRAVIKSSPKGDSSLLGSASVAYFGI